MKARRCARTATGLAAKLLLLAGLGSACGAGSGPRLPEPTLAAKVSAQRAFRPLSAAWLRGTPAERARLEPQLQRFAQRFADDPLARLARAWLGWIALDRGDLGRADALARDILTGPPGVTRDLAQVVQGVAERRRGRPERALATLAPLSGKLIDAYVRALLNEEVVSAAIEAGQPDEALRFMADWLREAPEDDAELIRAKIAATLQTVPEAKLLALLERPGPGATDSELRALAAQRLAGLVESRRDAVLARRLLAVAGSLVGDHGEAVAKLAVATESAHLDIHTVGLLLAADPADPGATRRGAEVAAGLASGLGLPGSGARLIVREADARSSVTEALLALLDDGAGLVVAGLDAEQATKAATFAADQRTPVVLLRPQSPGPTLASPFVFIVGDDPDDTTPLLRAALVTRGSKTVLEVREEAVATATTIACDPSLVTPSAALIVQAGPDCTARMLGLLAAPGPKPRFALGLESAGQRVPKGVLQAKTGEFRKDAGATVEGYQAWVRLHRRPPTWFEALGRDVGALASRALRQPALESAARAPTIAGQRAALTEAFARATAELWTTEARGFDGDRLMRRQISVIEQR